MKFQKKIVRSNRYSIPTKEGSREEEISSSRIKSWAKTANAMIKAGLRIPAPLKHDESVPVVLGPDGTIDAEDNQGFWTKFSTKEETDGSTGSNHTVLYGELDVPDSLADKVGKTIKETSVYVRPDFRDGLGRDWKDAILHVALVTHPVEPGQENFIPQDQALALSMSMEMAVSSPSKPIKPGSSKGKASGAYDAVGDDEGSSRIKSRKVDPQDPSNQGGDEPDNPDSKNYSSNISDLLAQLREIGKLDLPDDTDERTLAERLLAALRQKKLDDDDGDDDEGSVRNPPKAGKEPSKPIVMSINLSDPSSYASLKETDVTPEELNTLVMSHPAYKQQAETAKNLLSYLTDTAKRSLSTRVSKLVKAGKITKEYAEKHLLSAIPNHKVSFDAEGKTLPSSIETTLEALEAIPSASAPEPALGMSNKFLLPGDFNQVRKALLMSMGGSLGDLELQEPPTPQAMSDADMDKLADELAGVTR